eukprot:6203117-Pleurochrysis_carterae.AAC.2
MGLLSLSCQVDRQSDWPSRCAEHAQSGCALVAGRCTGPRLPLPAGGVWRARRRRRPQHRRIAGGCERQYPRRAEAAARARQGAPPAGMRQPQSLAACACTGCGRSQGSARGAAKSRVQSWPHLRRGRNLRMICRSTWKYLR